MESRLSRVLRRKLPPVPTPPSTTIEELDDSEDSSGDVKNFVKGPWTRANTRSSTNRQTPQRPEYPEKNNRRSASIPQRRAVAEQVDEIDDEVSDSERRDFNQNSLEFEDMSTTSSSNSFTSRASSICPHCDKNIPQEELPAHLHQHVLTQTINYARLKEIMLRQKSRHDQSSPSVDHEPPSSSSSDSLLRSDRVDRVTQGEFYCGKCSSVFTNSFEFELHERNHQAESLFKCQHCNKTFTKADVYEKHSKIHTGEAAHKCHLCPKTFNQRVHLRSHLRKHNGEKPYGCSFCPRQYADRSSLTYHERTHTGERPYPCPYCSRGFSKSGALKGHIVTHMRGPQEDLESGQGTSDEAGIQVHGNSKRIMDTAFHACQYCHKTFANLSTVRIHERCHSGERPYTCTYANCSKTFCQLAHLNTHLKTHEGVPRLPVRERRRVFVCLRCPSEFSSVDALSEHMTLDHGGVVTEEAFTCEYCPQTFHAEKLLQKHLTSFHKLTSQPEAYELSE